MVKSPGNMMGYYKMPEKTAEEFTADGFFKTGDQGEIDEMGRLSATPRGGHVVGVRSWITQTGNYRSGGDRE